MLWNNRMPNSLQNIPNSVLVNCRPLSAVILTGVPNRENISLRMLIVCVVSIVLVFYFFITAEIVYDYNR